MSGAFDWEQEDKDMAAMLEEHYPTAEQEAQMEQDAQAEYEAYRGEQLDQLYEDADSMEEALSIHQVHGSKLTPWRVTAIMCAINREVAGHLGWSHAADCFCKARTQEELNHYQHEGNTLQFIADAVDEKIAREQAAELANTLDPDTKTQTVAQQHQETAYADYLAASYGPSDDAGPDWC